MGAAELNYIMKSFFGTLDDNWIDTVHLRRLIIVLHQLTELEGTRDEVS
jgi:hypothetical protein